MSQKTEVKKLDSLFIRTLSRLRSRLHKTKSHMYQSNFIKTLRYCDNVAVHSLMLVRNSLSKKQYLPTRRAMHTFTYNIIKSTTSSSPQINKYTRINTYTDKYLAVEKERQCHLESDCLLLAQKVYFKL